MTTSFTIPSNQDQLPLSVMLITPPENITPCGILQVSHGMCDHKERYQSFLEYMTKHGYLCIIHDHRGHGKSIRKETDLGYFYTNPGQATVADLHQITEWITKEYPSLPIFLLGHSMGSLIARCYLKQYPDVLDGLILCGSPSAALAMDRMQRMTSRLIERKGKEYHSKWIEKTIYTAFQHPFRSEKRKNAWICSDPTVVETYNQDPLCQFNFTLNGYEALLYFLRTTYDKGDWTVTQPDLPIRFLSGAEDPCRGNDEKFQQAVQRLKTAGYQNVTSHLFPHMRHEILNEQGKAFVYADILETLAAWRL